MTKAAHPTMVGSDVLRDQVDRALSRFLDEKAVDFAEFGDAVDLLAVIRTFVLSGGKRLRPLFCYWGWRGAGGADAVELYAAAASLELFHAFGLIHDDIMDDSHTRRGRPTVHHQLAHRHHTAGWSGDPTRFGASVAILCGDLLLAWSDELLQHCGLPPHRINTARRIVATMRSELMLGQHHDLLLQARGGSIADALTVIRFKTAKYTVERPLHIGGALAGATPAQQHAYSAFAIPLGEAFQLRDDILGVFGDPHVTGKSILDDLRDGKPTVLIALTEASANTRQAEQLRQWHGNSTLDETHADTLRDIITTTGALTRTEQMINDRISNALSALHHAPVTDEARAALQSLAIAATDRGA